MAEDGQVVQLIDQERMAATQSSSFVAMPDSVVGEAWVEKSRAHGGAASASMRGAKCQAAMRGNAEGTP